MKLAVACQSLMTVRHYKDSAWSLNICYNLGSEVPNYHICYGHPPAMLAACHSVLLLSFTSLVFFFFCYLISAVTWQIVMKLCHMFNVTQIYKIQSEIWVTPSPEIWQPKNIKISVRFHRTSWLDREYLKNATIHRQLETGVANYGHSHIGSLNSV